MKKDKENAMIDGVCAGLAKEFKVNVIVIRLVFLFCQPLHLVYLALMFLMDDV